MRVLIMADMEGVSGITVSAQTVAGESLYQEGRRLMTKDVNAAVQGAQQAGAREIVIVDFHGNREPFSWNNLIPEKLHPASQLVAHNTTVPSTVLELGFDACVVVGCHAQANTPDGVLAHTMMPTFRQVSLNGQPVGEIDIVAALCGEYDIPVIAVTGDTAFCRQARALLGDLLHTVEVKQGMSVSSALCIAPKRARRMIKTGVRQALKQAFPPPFVLKPPLRIEVELKSSDAAVAMQSYPSVQAVDSTTISIEGQSIGTILNTLFSALGHAIELLAQSKQTGFEKQSSEPTTS